MVTLVTGATGLLGNNVVRSLLDRGMPVRVLARENSDARPFAGLQVEMARGDMRDRDAVGRAVEGVSCVIHAAGYVHIGWRGLEQARSINVEGTRHLAEAARAANAKFVHVSSLDALGTCQRGRANDEETPLVGGVPCPYVLTKREGEQVILDLVAGGLDARIVNPGYMIGPYDWKPSSGRMLLQVARGWGLFAPLGGKLLLRRTRRRRRHSRRGRSWLPGPAIYPGWALAQLLSGLANFCPGHRRHAADVSRGADSANRCRPSGRHADDAHRPRARCQFGRHGDRGSKAQLHQRGPNKNWAISPAPCWSRPPMPGAGSARTATSERTCCLLLLECPRQGQAAAR